MPEATRQLILSALLAAFLATLAATGCGSGGEPAVVVLSNFTATRLVAQPNGEILLLGRTGGLETEGCEVSDLAAVSLSDAGRIRQTKQISVEGCLRGVQAAEVDENGAIAFLTEIYHPNSAALENNATTGLVVMRMNRDGGLDTGFMLPVSSRGGPSAFGVLSDGSLIDADGRHWLENGEADGDFASSRRPCPPSYCSGNTYANLVWAGSQDSASGVAVQPDDSFAILSEQDLELTGTGGGPGGVRQVRARKLILRGFTAKGGIDLRFGTSGRSIADSAPPHTKFGYGGHQFLQIEPTPDGGYVVFGRYPTARSERFVALKFASSGRLDTGFGDRGRLSVLADLPAAKHLAVREISVQDDGKLIAIAQAGQRQELTLVARYEADGGPDRDFGNAGVATLRIGTGVPLNVVQSPGGRLVGASADQSGPTTVFRLSRDGRPDRAFGRAGVVHLSAPNR